MSLITHIDNIPLFTTILEAENWGSQYGLSGYHQHTVLGQIGYMGGTNHNEIVNAVSGGTVLNLTSQQIVTARSQPPQSQSTPSSSSGSSYGGGY